jgi:DNA-binding GntR family transcriptional regulator
MNNSLRNKAFEEIKRRIISFELKPGERIIEGEIAKDLAIGRTPVREALLMIEHENLVDCKSRMGYVVRKLTPKEVEDYVEIRGALERFAVPMMIAGASPEVIADMEENIRVSETFASSGDFHELVSSHADFHQILYGATNSQAFIHTIAGISDKLQWIRAICLRSEGGFTQSQAEHRRILQALVRKDEVALAVAIQVHLDHAKEKFLSMQALLF